MTEDAGKAGWTVDRNDAARDALLQSQPSWAQAGPVDLAGLQLILAAMRAGLTPPDAILLDEDLGALCAALGVGDLTQVARKNDNGAEAH